MAKEPRYYDLETRTFLPGARASVEPYRILKRCHDRGDIAEWQTYRKGHSNEHIWLCGADLEDFILKSPAYEVWRADHKPREMTWVEGVAIQASGDCLDLHGAHLDGADLFMARLRGTRIGMASVNGQTVLHACPVDRRTDATGVPLDAARVEPGLKILLQYDVRRIAWETWYTRFPVAAWDKALLRYRRRENRVPRRLRAARAFCEYLKRLSVQPFWWLSDYGRVTWHILAAFLFFAAYFAGAYGLYPPYLLVNGRVVALRGLWHALYFSIVTQTTLGFGDVHANPASPYNQFLLMLQVILGYALLGALVTRFAVLFAAGGPAGRFSPKEGRERQDAT